MDMCELACDCSTSMINIHDDTLTNEIAKYRRWYHVSLFTTFVLPSLVGYNISRDISLGQKIHQRQKSIIRRSLNALFQKQNVSIPIVIEGYFFKKCMLVITGRVNFNVLVTMGIGINIGK